MGQKECRELLEWSEEYRWIARGVVEGSRELVGGLKFQGVRRF